MNARQWLADTPSMADTQALKLQVWSEQPQYPFNEGDWNAWVFDCRRVEAMLWFVELMTAASAPVFSITPPDLQQVIKVDPAAEGDDQRVPFFKGDVLTCPYCQSDVWAEDEWCEDCGAVYDLVDGWSAPAIEDSAVLNLDQFCGICANPLEKCDCYADEDNDPDDRHHQRQRTCPDCHLLLSNCEC